MHPQCCHNTVCNFKQEQINVQHIISSSLDSFILPTLSLYTEDAYCMSVTFQKAIKDLLRFSVTIDVYQGGEKQLLFFFYNYYP